MKKKLLVVSVLIFLTAFFKLYILIENEFETFAENVVIGTREGNVKIFSKPIESYESIKEEEFTYDLDFLVFSKVAEAKVSLKKIGNRTLVATLDAKTKGIIGWLVVRHHTYVSTMTFTEDNKLRPYKFERTVKNRSSVEKSVSVMDYKKRKLLWRVIKNGKLEKEGVSEIPLDVEYEDVLSSFYNFRYGFFGDIVKGKTLVLNTIPDKGIKKVTIKVLSKEEEAKDKAYLDFKAKRKIKKSYLVHVTLPKKLFGSKEGTVKIWFGSDLIPYFGNVEDALALGDIIGKLKEKR